MKFTLQEIQNVLNQKNYQFDNDLNIIGVRSNNDIADSFDDWLYLIYNNGSLEIKEFPITTDPGLYWLNNPMNVDGTSVLVPNQYINVFKLGLFQGQYECLIQNKLMRIWRDNNKDNKVDKTGPKFEGNYGINIHRSNPVSESTKVGKWSAGAQVFQKAADFNFFMDVCKQSGKQEFTYTLLNETDF